MVRMSMNELSTFRWTFEEDVQRYVAAGYSAIGVWRQKLSDFGDERGVEYLRDQPIAVSHLAWAGGFTGSEGRRSREAIDDAIEAIQLTADLGADCLVVYTGSRCGHTMNHSRRMCRNALTELIPIAESAGVTLALEPVHEDAGGEWSFLHELDTALEFLDEINSAQIKLAFDTYHLGLSLVGDPKGIGRLQEVGERVAIIHLADAKSMPRGEQNRCLLGDGIIPIADIVAALMDGGFDGHCDVKLIGQDMERQPYSKILSHSRLALSQMIGV